MNIIVIFLIVLAVCIAMCLAVCRHWVQQVRRDASKEAERTITRIINKERESWQKSMTAMEMRITDLENGTVPDFEQAKEAARAVNDFNKGLSAIMGYDPFEARKKAQEERGSRA